MKKSTTAQAKVRRLSDLPGDALPKYLLMPGDPERISVMAAQWDTADEFPLARGYRLAIGKFRGERIAALSSGIGGPSLENILVQAAEHGVHTVIRVGTTGSLGAGIENGVLIIEEGAVRMDGTSTQYVRNEYPAAASYEVTLALIQAAEDTAVPYHVGIGATSASFYAGQGRHVVEGHRSEPHCVLREMRSARVLNFDMEASTLLTLCRLFGVRAGVVCSVVVNRQTDEWSDDIDGGIDRACRAGAEAVYHLHRWDRAKRECGKRFFFPGLLGSL